MTIGGPAVPEADALTSDGGIVTIRPVADGDRPDLSRLFGEASPENLRLRFFCLPSSATINAEIDRLCRPDDTRHLAVVATEAGRIVGVASCERPGAGSPRAEFAVFVADAQHGRGIGTLLLEHLAARPRPLGVTELTGEVLPGNIGMLRVARDLSTHTWTRFAGGIVGVGVDTRGDDAAEPVIDARDRTAERASLRALLSPRSVAVVGAGHTRGGVGHETLRALREYGFPGHVYAVNRTGAAVDGVPGSRSLRDLPRPVDLVVVAVPAGDVPAVVRDAAAAGARGVVVLSAGFAEQGPAGRRRQQEILGITRAHGMRLVGPNCLGILNTDPAVRLNACFAPAPPPAGGLAVAAQSGAVGVAVLDNAIRTGCGVSSFVSLGTKADVSGNDLIAYWYDDPATRAVVLHLESFGNPRRFARTVRALSRRKPVLAVRSSRCDRAATVDALFEQAGVIHTRTLGELLDAARMLSGQPLPRGHRLAILGNAGGLTVLAADAAEGGGLQVRPLSHRLRREIASVSAVCAGTGNPVDLGADVPPGTFAEAAAVLADSGEVDALLLVIVGTRTNAPAAILSALGAVADARPELPVAAVLVGRGTAGPAFGERCAPVFDLPERAVTALAHAASYAAWRRRPLGTRPVLPGLDIEGARSLIRHLPADGGGRLTYQQASALLQRYGIPVLAAELVTSGPDAVAAAGRLGFPVVLKSADPALVRRSDAGAVRLNLTGAAAVRAAFDEVTAAGAPGTGAMVQRQVRAPVELVAGIAHDPLFGSVVLLGAGGARTGLPGDRSLRLVPMTDLDAARMWRDLRAAPLLTGCRGAPPVDTAAVEDLVLRLGRLAENHPEVAELDLDPVFAGPDGVLAVDVRLRLAPVGAEPDATLRSLRARDGR
ncbi:GNAT family N-acetyltransferase [Couchioplanes caeruleus]|uniref:bifunctional acetate--CoA ligase family protein/GNAT family N-acetyltransferase n=1 Tax=Couchioplanes caeruleus TaxID=56438 RepID=UPI00201C9915|nr:bifunctional GNAT family N-acetyltransferase/acetate--CoA ligase family protein [Couchioplanes caeruleus]UQU61845.1 GNAT family N-acetyltransferase [Couchioplanes caeruleus]